MLKLVRIAALAAVAFGCSMLSPKAATIEALTDPVGDCSALTSPYDVNGLANSRPSFLLTDVNGHLCVNATVSATVAGGFTAAALGTPFTASEAGQVGTLPAGTVVVVSDGGAVGAYCNLGATPSQNGVYIAGGGGWFAFIKGVATQVACQTKPGDGNVVINMIGGTGLPTGTGGGGGGGGGGAITGPLGPSTADTAAVAITDTGTPITGQTISAGGQGLTGWLSQVYGVLAANIYTPGIAGTPSAQVLTVQGIGSMTKLLVTPDANSAVNVAQIAGNTTPTGNGTTGTGSQRMTIASDNTAFAVNAQPSPTTTGGLTPYFLQPTASDNHAVIKAGAGQVYNIMVTNNSATINYLRLYNATTGFAGCGSATNLVYQVMIPANATNGAGVRDQWTMGMSFATGISICVTSGYATTDTTNATASAMSVNIGYK